MPFIQPEPFTFFNIKLTDHGRRKASEGNLKFKSLVISDSEIDYSINRNNNYNFFNNKILDISEFYPDTSIFSFNGGTFTSNLMGSDGSSYDLQNESNFDITTERIILTASSSSTTISNVVSMTKTLAYGSNSSNWGTNKITIGGGGTPTVGQIIAIPWVSPDYSGSYNPTTMPQNDPCVLSFYKIISAVTAGSVYLVDRPIPDFGTGAFPILTCQIFNDNLIENYLGSGTTSDPGIWNMNIVRTNTVMGTVFNTDLSVSGYSCYGSIEFNGSKRYFGFKNELPVFGIIHYTNKWTGNTYAEQFVEGTFEMNLPGIMWHHNYNAYYNNDPSNIFSSYNGMGTTWGLYLSDSTGDTKYDSFTKTTYRELYDNRSSKPISVGRVYHKLQLIIITDQELLTALTYKSNRNYTLPDFNVSFSDMPQQGYYPPGYFSGSSFSGLTLTGFTASPFVTDGNDYFITYIAENDVYNSGISIGNAPSLPCGYIKKIRGQLDFNGNKQYLKIRFPNSDSFPYMRDDNELSLINYGTGWNANTVQILINIQPAGLFEVGDVPYMDWIRVSDKTLGGNGVYRASDYGMNTIDPKLLNSFEFVIAGEDINSGSTYVINTGFTANQTFLNFGDECFVYGTIKTGVASVVYKSSIIVYLDDSQLNSSQNSTFRPDVDKSTYITEIAVLGEDNSVLAVGKPTYPISKNNVRWLTLKLDIDF